jgi:hypothetical protein
MYILALCRLLNCYHNYSTDTRAILVMISVICNGGMDGMLNSVIKQIILMSSIGKANTRQVAVLLVRDYNPVL